MTGRIRAHLLRSRRRLVALAVVALATVPVVEAAERLEVHVDGEVVDVLSFASTVADLLAEQGVELAAGDEVLPAPTTPLDAVDSITVLRTIDVELEIDGRDTELRGTWRTVEGLLADLGIALEPGQTVRPGVRTVLADGDRVTITSPTPVTVTVDGGSTPVGTHLATVGELLDSLAVELGADDVVVPDRSVALVEGLQVVVQRVAFDEEVEEVVLPHDEEVRTTSGLFEDESRVVEEGADGLRVETYRVRVVDGERTDRTLVGEEVVTEPITRVVERGTTPRPPPPSVDDGSVWYDLAQCESGGRWDYNGSSGYDGGLQFHPDTWTRNKLAGYPQYAWQASAAQQIEVGKVVQRRSGWGAWPSCSSKLGLR